MNIIEQTQKQDNITTERIEKAKMTFEALRQEGYPAILNSEQVAKLLGMKESTIRNWTCKNKIPHQKLGGFVRYMLADIAFWLSGNINFDLKNKGNYNKKTNDINKLQIRRKK
jgi:excisionase family DNA binding protein